jgi:hypothetical protein
MKSYLGIAMVMAAMEESFNKPSKIVHEIDPDVEMMRRNNSEYERNTKRGLKLFYYGNNHLWAKDQNNADRKAKLKGWDLPIRD